MKKHTFYSLVMGNNFRPVAKKWDGFTDGKYNYYKNEETSISQEVGYRRFICITTHIDLEESNYKKVYDVE